MRDDSCIVQRRWTTDGFADTMELDCSLVSEGDRDFELEVKLPPEGMHKRISVMRGDLDPTQANELIARQTVRLRFAVVETDSYPWMRLRAIIRGTCVVLVEDLGHSN